jgi:hypothetical protein
VKLEVGKKYKTRSGLKAFVFSMSGREQEAIGYIELQNNQGHVPSEWFSDGLFYNTKKESAYDIVAEWTDEPDPGEGWRLLHPDEDLEAGDECYLKFDDPYDDWAKVNCSNNKQTPGMHYRRRAAPQYVPYTWEDRVELRGRWCRIKDGGTEAMVLRFSVDGDVFCMNGLSAEFFLNECEWLDGTPCGKVVV